MVALRNKDGANEERKFSNYLTCPTPQSLADAHCLCAVQ